MGGARPLDDDHSPGAAGLSAHVVVRDIETPELEEEDARYLGRVLRLRAGERVGATDGRGSWRVCRFVVPARPDAGAELEVDGAVERAPARGRPVCVGLPPVKGERTGWAVQKLTELGVDRIVVIRSERSVVRWEAPKADAHVGRLRRVARAAVMQSRGCWLPEVQGVLDFGEAVRLEGACLAAPAGRAGPTLARSTVLVGPEGGWSPAEMASDAAAVSLGPTILRTETAAVVAGALLAALRARIVSEADGPGGRTV